MKKKIMCQCDADGFDHKAGDCGNEGTIKQKHDKTGKIVIGSRDTETVVSTMRNKETGTRGFCVAFPFFFFLFY